MKPDIFVSIQNINRNKNSVVVSSPLRLFSVQMLATIVLVSIAALNLSSCAGSDLGKDLSISASPSDEYIVSSNSSSCVDLYNFSLAQKNTSSTSPPVLAQSVTGPRLFYPNFTLQWRGATNLTIVAIRVTAIGNNTNALSPSVTTLSNDEVTALLGQINGVIAPGLTINSNDTKNRGVFPVCGFNVGGLSVTQTSTPSIPANSQANFSARVMIEVIGTYQSADLTYHPVKQSWIGSAQYLN